MTISILEKTAALHTSARDAGFNLREIDDTTPGLSLDEILVNELEAILCVCTSYDNVSLQPNAGSQGEFAGLLAIQGYHHSRGDDQRTI